MSASDSVNQICAIRIELVDSDPLIWREIEVPSSITLWDLHDIIQSVMNWEDYHLWEFTIGKLRYGIPSDEDFRTPPTADAAETQLAKVLKPRKTSMLYTYDFGDNWEHRLIVSSIRAGTPGVSYPRLIAGERNAPPEDCGGIFGLYDKLAIRSDPDAPDPDELRPWLGKYNPDRFDERRIKSALGRIAKRLHAANARIAANQAKSAAKQ
jgi:hypothetical protein